LPSRFPFDPFIGADLDRLRTAEIEAGVGGMRMRALILGMRQHRRREQDGEAKTSARIAVMSRRPISSETASD